jgi:hypothetical protein
VIIIKQKKLTIILALILCISFIVFFIAQYMMFYSTKPTFPEMIEKVITYSAENKWDKADETLIKFEKKWNQAKPLISVKYSGQDYSLLNIGFAGLRAAINAKNMHGAESAGKACILIFKNITSISPNP